MSQRVLFTSLVKSGKDGAKGKPSLNRANILVERDPKPGELAMIRVSFNESWKEARTHKLCNAWG